MNFIEAIKTIKRNENLRVKREGNANICYSSWYRKLYVEDRKNIFDLELFTPTVDDILAEDWYVVRDEKLHSFEEVLKALKKGKKIKRKNNDDVIDDYFSDKDYLFDMCDVMANDWIIIDKED